MNWPDRYYILSLPIRVDYSFWPCVSFQQEQHNLCMTKDDDTCLQFLCQEIWAKFYHINNPKQQQMARIVQLMTTSTRSPYYKNFIVDKPTNSVLRIWNFYWRWHNMLSWLRRVSICCWASICSVITIDTVFICNLMLVLSLI